MSLLKAFGFFIRYFLHTHRNFAIGGAVWGIVAALFFGLYSPLPIAYGVFGIQMVLGWPFGIKQMSGRLWLLSVVGLGLSIALIHFTIRLGTVHLGRTIIPLVACGFVGSAVFGSLLLCLRYKRPDFEAPPSAT